MNTVEQIGMLSLSLQLTSGVSCLPRTRRSSAGHKIKLPFVDWKALLLLNLYVGGPLDLRDAENILLSKEPKKNDLEFSRTKSNVLRVSRRLDRVLLLQAVSFSSVQLRISACAGGTPHGADIPNPRDGEGAAVKVGFDHRISQLGAGSSMDAFRKENSKGGAERRQVPNRSFKPSLLSVRPAG